MLGLGFGDEGKGAVVDALARRRRAQLVVRFNGGPQAAHHVVAPDGAVHCFAQIGAGALAGARTFLSRFMLVEPLALAREADVLARLVAGDPLAAVTIDRRCAVVTPFHRLLGRIEELSRGTARHGSCGLGVGPAWRDATSPHALSLRVAALTGDPAALRRTLRQIQLVKLDRAEQLVDAAPDVPELAGLLRALGERDLVESTAAAYEAIVRRLRADEGESMQAVLRDSPGAVLFEGAQGALLDADLGFFPHVTPSRVGFAQAEALVAECPHSPPPLRVGVLRAYATRHGAGPFVSEAPGLHIRLPESHNPDGPWQGPMRAGWFDLVAARYGLAVAGGADGLVVTHLDRLAGWEQIPACEAWLPQGATSPITHLEPRSGPLDARTAFTAWVAACRPVLRTFPGWRRAGDPGLADYLGWISTGLAVTISATAHGPRALDQRWPSPCAGEPAPPVAATP